MNYFICSRGETEKEKEKRRKRKGETRKEKEESIELRIKSGVDRIEYVIGRVYGNECY